MFETAEHCIFQSLVQAMGIVFGFLEGLENLPKDRNDQYSVQGHVSIYFFRKLEKALYLENSSAYFQMLFYQDSL